MPSQAPPSAQEALDAMAKPPGSLGTLEIWAARLCELQGSLKPSIQDAALVVFAADHGVALEAPLVSAYPRQLTAAVFEAIADGQAASSVLTRENGCKLLLVDVGIDGDVTHVAVTGAADADAADARATRHIRVQHAKVARGTATFTSGPAMSLAELEAAMAAGAAAVRAVGREAEDSAGAAFSAAALSGPSRTALCLGELGIGNTTAAAALVAALTGAAPGDVCGRGTGVDDAGLAAKQKAVAAALAANRVLVAEGALGALQAVGGLEIAAMAGAYLEAARLGMPVIVDGFISSAAALAAVRHDPACARCLFLAHSSAERGARIAAEALGQRPALDMGLRLGEGTGAVLALPLLRSAAALMRHMAPLGEVLAQQAQRRQRREAVAGAGHQPAAGAADGPSAVGM